MAVYDWICWSGLKWLKMAVNCYKWQEMAGNGWNGPNLLKIAEMAENGLKFLEIVKLTLNDWNGCKRL